MKLIRAPLHQNLMRPYLKKTALKKQLEEGVQRLKVISQIIQLRQELGLTQAELAQRMKVSQAYIARIENDKASNLSLETLVKLVNALNADIEIHIRSHKKAA